MKPTTSVKAISLLAFAALLTPAIADDETSMIIVDDSFADGNRAQTGPLDANWWSSNDATPPPNSLEVDENGLGLVTGNSGRGLHCTFESQNLEVGQTLTVTATFTTPETVGSDKTTAFKFALMDGSSAALAADLDSSSSDSNPVYVGVPGYMFDLDVNETTSDEMNNVIFRKHVVTDSTGRFLGTTGEWDSLAASSGSHYAFTPDTEYVVVFSIARTGEDEVTLSATLSQNGVIQDSHTVVDASDIANNIGMFGVWVNSDTFGSTNEIGVGIDNGITFSNVKIEVTAESD